MPHPDARPAGRRHTWVCARRVPLSDGRRARGRASSTAGGHRLAGRARATAGARRALGVVGDGRGRAARDGKIGPDAARGVEGRDAEARREKIGLLPDLGTVETGKLADLVVLDADPLADIHNSVKIRCVIKNGAALRRGRRWRRRGRRSAAPEDVLAGGAMSDAPNPYGDRSRRDRCPRIPATDTGGDRARPSIARRRAGSRSGLAPGKWTLAEILVHLAQIEIDVPGPAPLRAGDARLPRCSRSIRTGSWPVEPAMDGDAALAAMSAFGRFALPLIDRLDRGRAGDALASSPITATSRWPGCSRGARGTSGGTSGSSSARLIQDVLDSGTEDPGLRDQGFRRTEVFNP